MGRARALRLGSLRDSKATGWNAPASSGCSTAPLQLQDDRHGQLRGVSEQTRAVALGAEADRIRVVEEVEVARAQPVVAEDDIRVAVHVGLHKAGVQETLDPPSGQATVAASKSRRGLGRGRLVCAAGVGAWNGIYYDLLLNNNKSYFKKKIKKIS